MDLSTLGFESCVDFYSFSSHWTWTDLMSAGTVGLVLTDQGIANGTCVLMRRTKSSGAIIPSARRPQNTGFFIVPVRPHHR